MRVQTALFMLVAMLTARALSAQGHGYTPQDIENGGLLYQSNCTGCHGPEGDGVPSVDLSSGRFRRGTTDDELVKIIIGGVPGTAMPPSSFSEGQVGTIVAYLRSLAASPTTGAVARGDAGRGKALFETTGQCLTCHSVRGVGSTVAPALTDIGSTRRAVELQRSILDPGAEIRTDNRSVRAVTRQGATITGRLLNQDTFTLQILDANQRLVLLDKATLREHSVLAESPMPSYRGRLTDAEVADLVGYLTSLRGR